MTSTSKLGDIFRRIGKRFFSSGDFMAGMGKGLGWIEQQTLPEEGIAYSRTRRVAYPEVTGYLIPTLLACGEHDKVLQYARWLVTVQNTDGSWSDVRGKFSYTFDTGQILKGLFAAMPRYPEAEEAVRKGCDWMLTQIEASGRVTTPDKGDWLLPGGKEVSENIHLYTLEPLRRGGLHFGERKYTDAVDRALGYYLAQKDLSCFNTLSHFHAYVMEALVDLGFPDLAEKGMKEVEEAGNSKGSVPGYPGAKWVCSTGLAQYAVVWYKLGQTDRADRVLDYVLRLQNSTGGFYGGYGPGASYFPRDEISWAVKYFLDACLWRIRTSFDRQIKKFPSTVQESDDRVRAIVKGLGERTSGRILDAGCGKGRFSHCLHRRWPGVELWGVDLSEAMLKWVGPGIRTHQGTLVDLPFASGFFDGVFCVEALEHSLRPEGAVEELCRVTRPGGKVVIVDKNVQYRGQLGCAPWEKWFSRDQVEAWLAKSCDQVHSEFIAYGGMKEPDGWFIAWWGTRRE